MAIILDTGFYAGLIHPKDEHRQDSFRVLDAIKDGTYGAVFTSNYIVAETATLCAVRSGRNPAVLATCAAHFTGPLRVATIINARDVHDADTWTLFQKLVADPSLKHTVSFVDCSTIVLARQLGIEHVASYDQHFDAWLHRVS